MDRNGVALLRRILLWMILFESLLLASDKSLATNIYLSIAKELSQQSDPKFYLHGSIKYLHQNSEIGLSLTCEQADIIILNTLSRLPDNCKNKLIFTNNYKTYRNHEDIVGAFFWQKGRPNIVFRQKVLHKKNILLNASFRKYIE